MAISKINEKVFEAFAELNDFADTNHASDFDTREKSICANIKVYEWLDEDDVVDLINKNDWQRYSDQILEEFDENRLNSVHNHTCEDAVRYLKEVYEDNIDLTDYARLFRVWHQSHNNYGRTKEYFIESQPESKYYTQEYWDKSLAFDNYNDWEKHVTTDQGGDYERWVMRSKIDKFECWQYGRRGGWFSICRQHEVDFSDILVDNFGYNMYDDLCDAYNKGDNYEFNQILLGYGYQAKDKQDLIESIKTVLSDARGKIAAIEYIVDEIESEKPYFKENLLNTLENEISNFIEYELDDTTLSSNVSVDIKDDLVVTTLGVSVGLDEFRTNLLSLLPSFAAMTTDNPTLYIERKVGRYFVERASKVDNDILIKAGCHRFSLNNLLTTFNLSL